MDGRPAAERQASMGGKMKRLLVLVLAVGFVSSAAAYTGLTGGRGLFRVQDARSEEGGWIGSLQLHGLYRWADYDDMHEAWRKGITPEMTAFTNDLTGTVSLAPCRWFELFFWHGGVREYTTKHPDSSLLDMGCFKGYTNFWDWHNMVPGVKVSVPVLSVVKLGMLGGYSMTRSGEDIYGPRSGWRWGVFGLPLLNGPTWTGLVTAYLPDITPNMPTVHLNYGQTYDSYTPIGGTEVKATYSTLGAAVEYDIGELNVFAEFFAEEADNMLPFGDNARMRVTPGVRIGYLKPFVLEFGASFGLTDNMENIELIAGLGLQGDLYTAPKPTTGTIAGRVVDAVTGEPVVAFIAFPTRPKVKSMSTSPDQGTFTAKKVKYGTVMVRAMADGYLPSEQAVEVVINQVSQVEFALKPEATMGSIAGSVTDAATGDVLTATIEFPGSDLAGMTSGETGFRVDDVLAGEYKVQAAVEGYMTATATVRVLPEQVARADIELVKRGVKITLKVYFDFDQATLKPESRAALEGAAKIMTENAGIKVEIRGHTDNAGTDEYNLLLSQRRARAVVDYLVDKLGIDRARLSAKGFGMTNPVGPNDTEEERAQNRRAEFVVVE